jgi:site-specific DNA-methyltransferase (adenine-specific)
MPKNWCGIKRIERYGVNMESKSLTMLDNATRMLAEVKTIDDAKQIMDTAAAAQEIEREALIKLGEILTDMEKNKGGNPDLQPVDNNDRLDEPVTLTELGISRDLSSESQAIAGLPDEEKERFKKGKTSKKQAVNQIKQQRQKERLIEKAIEVKSLRGEILQGDFFSEIDKVQDNSIDLLFVDPPYGVLDETWDKIDIVDFTEHWLVAVMPKVKPTGRIYICFSQVYLFELYKILEKNNFYGFKFGQLLIWQYLNNNKPSNRKLYRYSYEPIYYLYGFDAPELNFTSDTYGETQNTVWTIATPQSNFAEGKYHPAQKPIELLERIIKTGSKENDLVLDPFAGSGTAGVACEKLNRNYILIEKEQEYIDIARGRLNGVAS